MNKTCNQARGSSEHARQTPTEHPKPSSQHDSRGATNKTSGTFLVMLSASKTLFTQNLPRHAVRTQNLPSPGNQDLPGHSHSVSGGRGGAGSRP